MSTTGPRKRPSGQSAGLAQHPLLSALADGPREVVAWRVFDALWSYADRFLDGDQRRDIGYIALRRGARNAAARLLSHTDSAIDPAAYNQIALLFYQGAEWADDRRWLQQAIATGHANQAPMAMVNLGGLEKEGSQPVTAGPAQCGDDGPFADAAGGVDAGDPVDRVLRD
jgi:hypothetical protein